MGVTAAAIKMRVKTPMVPNFLSIEGTHATIAVYKLSDEELKEVGRLWTEKLIDNAKKNRKNFSL